MSKRDIDKNKSSITEWIDKKHLITYLVYGIALGALTFGELNIIIYTAAAYYVSVGIIMIILATIIPRILQLAATKNSVKFSRNEYIEISKKIIFSIISLLTLLNLNMPLETNTTNVCIQHRRNIFTGPITEEDRQISDKYPLLKEGICAETKYGIYLF